MNDHLFSFERNRYFYGKMLTSADFQAEQQYVNTKRAFVNRMILGPGIICGLGTSRLSDTSVLVDSGVAIDGMGREIVVSRAVVRRLSSMEGYSGLSGLRAALCLKYKEEQVKQVQVIARQDDQEEYEYNRIQEGYELFLSDCTEEVSSNRDDMGLLADIDLLDHSDYRVSLKMPLFACKGKQLRLALEVEKLSDEETELSFEGILKLPAFKTKEGGNELDIGQSGIYLQKGERSCFNYWLYTKEMDIRTTSILWERGTAIARIDDEELEFGSQLSLEIYLEDFLPEDLVNWHTGYQSLESKKIDEQQDFIKIAELSLSGDNREEPVIDAVLEYQIKKYITVPETGHIRSSYLSYYKDQEEPSVTIRQEEESAEQGEAQTEDDRTWIRGGILEIPLDLKMKKGKVCYSEEVIHGLGPGNVYVDVGICNTKETAGGNYAGTDVIYGDNSLFEEKNKRETYIQTAVRVFQNKGSFQVAARLTGEQNTILLPLQWTAIKVPERPQEDVSDKKRQIIPETPTVRLTPKEKYCFSVQFRNMEPCELRYELMDEDAGDITQDGVYTAPAKCGIFEIRISCVSQKGLCTYVYAVVGGRE